MNARIQISQPQVTGDLLGLYVRGDVTLDVYGTDFGDDYDILGVAVQGTSVDVGDLLTTTDFNLIKDMLEGNRA